MGNTILIAEDHKFSLTLLARYFQASGFTVYPTATCGEAIKLADQYKPDCFLLDYHLVDRTADDICRFVRGNEYLKKSPIIILSGDTEQAIDSYEICQADAFIEKGKSYDEIMAVIRRLVQRAEWERGILKKPDLTLDARTLRLLKGDRPIVQLSPEQFRFLAILFERNQAFVKEDELCAYVFADTPSGKREAIASLAYRLRRKLGPQLSRRIKNKRYRGWIYIQPRLRNKDSSPAPLAA